MEKSGGYFIYFLESVFFNQHIIQQLAYVGASRSMWVRPVHHESGGRTRRRENVQQVGCSRQTPHDQMGQNARYASILNPFKNDIDYIVFSGRIGDKVDHPIRSLEPVPGLPGALPPPPGLAIHHAQLPPPPDDFFNLHRLQAAAAPLTQWPAWRPPPPPLTLHYPSQDPDRMGSHLNPGHQ
jgi:hypothetical protein